MSKNIVVKEKIKNLIQDPSNVFIVNYSQANVYNSDISEFTPMITSILILSLDKKICEEFSVYKEADKMKEIDKNTINDIYTDLEHVILGNFNNFLKHNKNHIWMHWNMNNSKFGFEAIKHRFMKMVEGTNEKFEEIPFNNKIDLNSLIEQAYGINYSLESDKLISIAKFNRFNYQDKILTLEQEAKEFNNKNFNAVIDSLEQKAYVMMQIIETIQLDKLKVPQRGLYAECYHLVTHPAFGLVGFFVGLIGTVISIYCLF